jgi:prepilin-type processing-associated H-X9-DG protein
MYTTYVAISGSTLDTGLATFATNIVSEQGVLIHRYQAAGMLNTGVGMHSVTDGTSNTIMVGEQSNHLRDANNVVILGASYGGPGPIAVTSAGPDGWIQGCRITVPNSSGAADMVYNTATIRYSINQRGMTLGAGGCHDNVGNNIPLSSMHPGGCNLLFADGTVRFFSSSTALTVLQTAACRNDGQIP